MGRDSSFVMSMPRSANTDSALKRLPGSLGNANTIVVLLAFGGVRLQGVVGVEKHHDRAVGLGKASIERGALSLIALIDAPDPIAEAVDHVARFVRRPVIDDDHLDVGVRLTQRRIDCRPDEAGIVEVVNDDTNSHVYFAVPA